MGNGRRRVDLYSILADPAQRKMLLVDAGLALQRREGIMVTQAQMEAAYEKVRKEITEGD